LTQWGFIKKKIGCSYISEKKSSSSIDADFALDVLGEKLSSNSKSPDVAELSFDDCV
jgi:hypothetical protein